jgi:hypothetical protein
MSGGSREYRNGFGKERNGKQTAQPQGDRRRLARRMTRSPETTEQQSRP